MEGIRCAAIALVVGVLTLFSAQAARAQEQEVAFAGVAFAGADLAADDHRFKYSHEYAAKFEGTDEGGYRRILALLRQQPPQNFKLTEGQIADLKGRDQAIVTALVLTSETVSTERFGDVRKLFIQLRGQAVFFDYKSMTMLRSYPLSFAYVDNLRSDPSDDDIRARVAMLFEGAGGKPGLYGRYARLLSTATLPSQTTRFLQVTHVKLPADMLAAMPSFLTAGEGAAETWAADLVSESISSRIGVPVVPYVKGAAIDKVLAVRIATGDVFTLKLPKPDYEIAVDFDGLKKVRYAQTAAGTSWIYGALAHVSIVDPIGPVLHTPLKNAEVKVVPASQSWVDDFPAYDDAVRGMFNKLADAVAGDDLKWLKAAAGAPDIEAQVTKTKDLMKLCK